MSAIVFSLVLLEFFFFFFFSHSSFSLSACRSFFRRFFFLPFTKVFSGLRSLTASLFLYHLSSLLFRLVPFSRLWTKPFVCLSFRIARITKARTQHCQVVVVAVGVTLVVAGDSTGCSSRLRWLDGGGSISEALRGLKENLEEAIVLLFRKKKVFVLVICSLSCFYVLENIFYFCFEWIVSSNNATETSIFP